MQKRVGMDNENKFYNIYRLCRKEGALTTRTGSTIYIDYAEKRGTCSRCPCPLFSA
jgi:hypothetical protein